MNNTFKVAIVGGGAAGLLCAIELLLGANALNGEEIVILERNDRVGKKLIATGNGQGNLTNKSVKPENYHGDKGFIRAFFPMLDEVNLVNYLENLGIFLTEKEEGKMYPVSCQAGAVLDVLRSFLAHKNCKIITGYYVDKIEKGKDFFSICSKNEKVFAENLVLAFGGMAGKQYGTDGSSYSLIEKFGHKKTKTYPSLIQLKADLREFKNLKGIKEKVKVKGFVDGKMVSLEEGDLLFTDFGVSWSAIFKTSAHLDFERKNSISIEFVPDLSSEELTSLLERKLKLDYIENEEILSGIVNKQIGKIIARKSANIGEMINLLKDYKLDITGSLGFDYAQVTKGGIVTDDVNPFTFQSKLVKNMYLAGELLNVDGDCGGYNLTFAFASGILCAKNIKNRY